MGHAAHEQNKRAYFSEIKKRQRKGWVQIRVAILSNIVLFSDAAKLAELEQFEGRFFPPSSFSHRGADTGEMEPGGGGSSSKFMAGK